MKSVEEASRRGSKGRLSSNKKGLGRQRGEPIKGG